ncbi:Uncharacterized protein APZ42_025774 [Daphnia magna]|uniref:Uncharacterized protein n=1 Tax=Daphnia magna TaxID=35525 RepID=A0A162DCL8_9CRUS|nr:Uncharacterized protein APZ42_025774 [Daphnia magna]
MRTPHVPFSTKALQTSIYVVLYVPYSRCMTPYGLIMSQGETELQKKGSPDMHFNLPLIKHRNMRER